MSRSVFYSEMEFRGIDVEKRQATFVASTEKPVRVTPWDPPEVLRMNGARLARFRKNPVVLDTHGHGTRQGLSSVIGKAEAKVAGRELQTTITYATTPAGEEAWTLVRDGIVRATSIGYAINPKRVLRLREGEFDGEGEARVEGPATVVREWTLLEISNVPVPADEDAVRRAYYETLPVKGRAMEDENETENAAGEGTKPTPEPKKTAPVAPVPSLPLSARTLSNEESRDLRLRNLGEVFEARVRRFTPKGLEHVADNEIVNVTEDDLLQGRAFEKARAALVKAQAERFKPVGTTEPKEPAPETESAQRSAALPDDITDEILVRSFENLR